jgi:exonuclease III
MDPHDMTWSWSCCNRQERVTTTRQPAKKPKGRGGVMLWVRNDIPYIALPEIDDDGGMLDAVVVRLCVAKMPTFDICSVYAPPSRQKREEEWNPTFSTLPKGPRVVIAGDFNAHGS